MLKTIQTATFAIFCMLVIVGCATTKGKTVNWTVEQPTYQK